MSLRRQSLSPTAALLRGSRLFALPNPLPRPLVAEPSGAGTVKASDSATLPYPTHQAIVTTPSSLARGDFGLKRPLPARSRIIQSSSPVVRINQWDTIEHVTDFDSAADHVRTREKYTELGIPFVKGMAGFSQTDATTMPGKSAFEEASDVTAYTSDEGLDAASIYIKSLQQRVRGGKENAGSSASSSVNPTQARVNQRWKHDGPWLPGVSAQEFTAYVSRTLPSRRVEFNKYLKEYVKIQLYGQRRQAALSAAPTALDAAEAEAEREKQEEEWSKFTPEEIQTGIRNLRTQCARDPLNSKLVQELIVPFLRLPPIKLKSTTYSQDRRGEVGGQKFDDDTTPNSTHPSAGLGYLRNRAYLANHPILGPQEKDAPVEARVVQPKALANQSGSPYARLGVAGFIANDEERGVNNSHHNANAVVAGVDRLDLDTPGGAKVSIQTPFAAVSPDGKIHIKTKRSYGEERRVKRGELENGPPKREGFQADSVSNLTGNNAEQQGMVDLLTTLTQNANKANKTNNL